MAAQDLFVENFKAQLSGGGARSNLFKVVFNLDNINNEKASFMCKSASLPGSTIPEIEVPFRGRVIKVAGDRTFEPWTITVINDVDFEVRNEFERMMNEMNSHISNLGDQRPSTYKRDMFVYQMDKNGRDSIKDYKFIGVFPTSIDPIEVSYDSANTIEEFTVTLQYDYWTSGTTS